MKTRMVIKEFHKFPEVEDMFDVHIVEYANCEDGEYVGDDNEIEIYKGRCGDSLSNKKLIFRNNGLSWKQEDIILTLLALDCDTKGMRNFRLNYKNLFGENLYQIDWNDVVNKFKNLGVEVEIKREMNYFTNEYTKRWVWTASYGKHKIVSNNSFIGETYAIMNLVYELFVFTKNNVKDFEIHYIDEFWNVTI